MAQITDAILSPSNSFEAPERRIAFCCELQWLHVCYVRHSINTWAICTATTEGRCAEGLAQEIWGHPLPWTFSSAEVLLQGDTEEGCRLVNSYRCYWFLLFSNYVFTALSLVLRVLLCAISSLAALVRLSIGKRAIVCFCVRFSFISTNSNNWLWRTVHNDLYLYGHLTLG